VSWIVGGLEGAVMVGGMSAFGAAVGGMSAFGAALYGVGIPKDSVLQY